MRAGKLGCRIGDIEAERLEIPAGDQVHLNDLDVLIEVREDEAGDGLSRADRVSEALGVERRPQLFLLAISAAEGLGDLGDREIVRVEPCVEHPVGPGAAVPDLNPDWLDATGSKVGSVDGLGFRGRGHSNGRTEVALRVGL
jgi:hypothetical protein